MAIENDLQISAYVHCGLCLEELPVGQSPQDYASHSVGLTRRGIQVWCNRHQCNVVHIDFEGTEHPANTTRKNAARVVER